MKKIIVLLVLLNASLSLNAMQLDEQNDVEQNDTEQNDECVADNALKMSDEELEVNRIVNDGSYKQCERYFQSAFDRNNMAEIAYIYLWAKSKQSSKNEVAASTGAVAAVGVVLAPFTFGMSALLTAGTAPVCVYHASRAKAYRKLKRLAKGYLKRDQSVSHAARKKILSMSIELNKKQTFELPSEKMLQRLEQILQK